MEGTLPGKGGTPGTGGGRGTELGGAGTGGTEEGFEPGTGGMDEGWLPGTGGIDEGFWVWGGVVVLVDSFGLTLSFVSCGFFVKEPFLCAYPILLWIRFWMSISSSVIGFISTLSSSFFIYEASTAIFVLRISFSFR